MKKTALYNEHLSLKGKIVDFEGWELPVLYSSIIDEHIATRTKASLFDVSHMGEVSIKGKNAETFLRKMIPTSLDKLDPGKCMYSCFCNEHGGVIDDIFVYMVSSTEYMLVINASTIDKDLRWLDHHSINDVEITNLSDSMSKLDLQGPFSHQILSVIIDDPAVKKLQRFEFTHSMYDNRPVIVSMTGYTGEAGYELYVPNASAVNLWNEILSVGKNFGLLPAGLGARDTLRLESCYSLYGHELSDNISPIESGIGFIVNSKDDYIAKDILLSQKKTGAPREMIALELMDRGVPREHCHITANGKEIGITTSGGFSPSFKKGISLGLVHRGVLKTGDTCEIIIRDKPCKAVVVKRPFYPYAG